MIADILYVLLLVLLYVILAVGLVGGTLVVIGASTALLVVTSTFPVLRRMPTVRQPLFDLTRSFTGDSPSGLKDKKFLAVYIVSVAFYSTVFFIVFARTYSIYQENRYMILTSAGVSVAVLFAVAGSGRLRGSRVQPILEWSGFVLYLTILCALTVIGAFWFAMESLDMLP